MRYEEIELESKYEHEEEEEEEMQGKKGHSCHVPTMKINCDLDVTVGSKNKIIYVCNDKLQYFTASAICCDCDNTIEIEYCGSNTKCICGEVVICGCLGYYKIVKSGIIFIPRHDLSKFQQEWFPTDILCFKVKDKDCRDIKFDVVFAYSRCNDFDHRCDHRCDKRCKC